MPGVKLNQKSPDFELKDLNGQAFRLSNQLGKRNVLLVFNRGFT